MRFRIYAKGVNWTKDSIDKPYFYSKEKPDIRKNINDFMESLIYSEWDNFKLNGGSLEIKTITLDMFDYMDSNYCSVLMNNKEYYYFIENIEVLNEKGLVRLSLQLDTWTTYFEEMVTKLGNSVVALRKHGKRFKRNKDNEVIYEYSRNSNVWNIDNQFSNLSKQTILKYPIFYKYPNLVKNRNLNMSFFLFKFEELSTLADVYIAPIFNGTSVEWSKDTNDWALRGSWSLASNLSNTITGRYGANDITNIDLYNSFIYTRVNEIKETGVTFNVNSPSELLISKRAREIDIVDIQARLDNTLFFEFETIEIEENSIDIGTIVVDFDKIKSLNKSEDFIIEYKPIILNNNLFVLNIAYIKGAGKPKVLIQISQSPLGSLNMYYAIYKVSSGGENPTQILDKIYIYSHAGTQDIETIGSDIFNKIQCIPSTGAPSGEPEYFGITPYETIDISNDNYDWKREPQIWMSHCYDLHFNRNGNKNKIRYEIDRTLPDFALYQYSIINMFFEGIIFNRSIENSESMFMIQYNPEIPSVTDNYKSYLKTNQNSLETSMYGIQKNIDFTKESGNLDIKHAQVSATMSGISSATNAIGGIVSGALGGVFSGTAGMIAGGIGGAVSGLTNMGNTIAQGAMGVEKAQLSAEKNNFSAEQQMRSAVASQLDLANTPDKLNGANIGEFQRFMGRERNGGLGTMILSSLPTISTLQEYADYLNRYGYISGNQIHDFNKDRILIRKRFNYWQIQDIAIAIRDRYKLPMFALKYFRDIFNVGVRMWSDVEGMYDYSKENWEYEI